MLVLDALLVQLFFQANAASIPCDSTQASGFHCPKIIKISHIDQFMIIILQLLTPYFAISEIANSTANMFAKSLFS